MIFRRSRLARHPTSRLNHPFTRSCILLGWILTAVTPLAWPGHANAQVVISEFMAANTGALLDEDGESSDWIELFNSSTTPTNLSGWRLTDDVENLSKWTFPTTNLGPGQFLVVFASGKNRAVAGARLHTN